MATTPAKRACSVCGTLLADSSEFCPVCALRKAVETQSDSVSDATSKLRFEHYSVLQNAEGKPLELERGAMGVTYKAFDVHLQRPAALKIINAQLFGNESARARFVREARAAASVRHQNVASVFHICESGGNWYYAMEFVEGESLSALIRRSGCLGTDLALDILEQAAAGLAAIEKKHLVHRDIKPSNIMVSCQDGKLENVKIIDSAWLRESRRKIPFRPWEPLLAHRPMPALNSSPGSQPIFALICTHSVSCFGSR